MANTPYFTKAETEAKINLMSGFSFTGKKIVCFGDSITERGAYPVKIASMTGATVYQIGLGGGRMGQHSDPNYDALCMYRVAEAVNTGDYSYIDTRVANLAAQNDDNTDIINRLKSINFNTVDIVTIFYGTNDYSSNNITIESATDEDLTTIKGATRYSIRLLLQAYPHLSIVVITPTFRFFGANNVDEVPNGLGLYMVEYTDAIKEVSDEFHIPCIDLFRDGGFHKYNHQVYFSDEVHLNTAGDTFVAQKIAAKLTSFFKF